MSLGIHFSKNYLIKNLVKTVVSYIKLYLFFQLLDNKWQSSSRDVIQFRKGLSNRTTALQFRKYVGLQGDLLENDALFWIEVQKYKVISYLKPIFRKACFKHLKLSLKR